MIFLDNSILFIRFRRQCSEQADPELDDHEISIRRSDKLFGSISHFFTVLRRSLLTYHRGYAKTLIIHLVKQFSPCSLTSSYCWSQVEAIYEIAHRS